VPALTGAAAHACGSPTTQASGSDSGAAAVAEANRTAAEQARARGVDIGQQLANLRDYASDRGERHRDWNARWRRRLRGTHAAPSSNGRSDSATEHVRKIPTLSPMSRRDPRVGRFEPPPDRPAQPELVPDDAVTVDSQGNVRDAGPFVAMLAERNRRGEP
jgi:hypothetical protein